jgi:NADH dehydrogenase
LTGFSSDSFELADSASTAIAEQPEPAHTFRDKPVAVTGASGLIGTHLCPMLVERGYKVRALVRDTAKAAQRIGHLHLEIRSTDIRNASAMSDALEGCGSIVHLAAIAIEKQGESYDSTNTDATRLIIDTARAHRIERLVYMSQNGSDSSSRYPFLRSKGIAQDLVTSSSLRWTVLRPSVIVGPEDEFVNVLARLVRLSPLIYPLPGGGSARFQPIAVDDVARAVVKCLEDDSTIGRSYQLGGPTPLSLRQMTERILIAMNARRALVPIPVGVLRPVIALAQRVLPHPPVTTGLLDLLDVDNTVDPNDLVAELGITPIPFAPEELLYLKRTTFSDAVRSLVS